MSGVNVAFLLGHLGADPELKETASGQSLATFRMATNDVWTDKEGQKQERTEWHRVVVWGRQAETVAKYLRKGREVHVIGQIQTREWEGEDGQTRYTTEIKARDVTFLGGAQAADMPTASAPREAVARAKATDDIPF